ncbi:MAG: MFS transporter [Candidatus Saccharibacteria bacterium]
MKQPFKWGLLGLLALAQFMVVLDTSIVNVALPAIQKALQFTDANLQWVITAYTLAFGGFLLLGGRAADLYGRRRMFIIGVSGFTTMSLLVGLSQNSTTMIIARGLQGLFAALMSPAALSIVLTSFKEGTDRNKALGIWGAVAAGGAAAGVLFGGLLTQYTSWEWNFFVNVPVGLFVVLMARRVVPLHAREVAHNDLDLPGAVLVTAGLMTLVFALTKAPAWGWLSGTTLGLFAAVIAMLGAFIWNEARAEHPLMPLSIFRIRNLTGANLVMMPIMAAMMSMFFFVSLYIQEIMRYTPVMTGVSFLPVTFIIGVVATVMSGQVVKIGYKRILMVAPLFVGAGLFWLGHIPVHGTYWGNVFPGLALVAMGMGATFVTATITATSGVPGNEAGLASGLFNTSQQIGGALGLAVLSGVAASHTTHALRALNHAPAASDIARATVGGWTNAFYAGFGFALLAALVATTVVKQHKHAATASAAAPVAMH